MRESVPLSQPLMPHRGPSSTGRDVGRALAGSRRALILVVTLFVSVAVAMLPSNVDASAVPPPLPTITNLTPNEGPTAGGTPVTLTGTHYEPANTQILIVFRTRGTITIPATDVTVNDTGTTATFTTPPAPEDGRAGIFAVTPAGRSNAQTFNYIAPPPPPLPTITNLTPNEGPTAGGTPVTLTGTHYEPANTQILIVFRTRGTITIPATNVTVNDTGTTATFTTPPAPEDGRAGIFAVTPAGRSNAQTFNYIAPPPPPLPTITNLTPNEGPTAGGTPVTLTGTHYEPANTQILIVFRTRGTITIPATNVTVNDTGTTATFTTPPAPEDGRAGIFAVTPAGRSNAQTFNYIAPPPPPLPTITNLTPNEGPTAGGTPVTLTGTHYEPANTQILIVFRTRGTITIPATNVTVNDTGTTATFTTPPAPEDGRAGIFAVTPAGRSNAQTFNYIAPPPPPLPTITNLTPNEGPTAGGTPVTLTGTHYEPANTQILIVFRTRGTITIPATNVTVNDTGTTATFTTPPAPEDGRAGIFAVTPAGRSNAQTFNYIAPPPPPLPTITNLTPNEGPTAGGTPVTLTGTHYEPANTQILIVFRTRGTITIPATNVTVNDTGTTATFTTPPAPEDGRAGIFAVTPAGRSNAQTFNYIAPPPPPLPTITNLTPNEGPTAGGTPVTLTGTHYEPANTQILIVFRTRGTITIPATNVTVNDTGTTATFTTPPAPEDGRAGIFAVTPAGRSNAQTFNYQPPSARRVDVDGRGW